METKDFVQLANKRVKIFTRDGACLVGRIDQHGLSDHDVPDGDGMPRKNGFLLLDTQWCSGRMLGVWRDQIVSCELIDESK
jgi:hypothetical protein